MKKANNTRARGGDELLLSALSQKEETTALFRLLGLFLIVSLLASCTTLPKPKKPKPVPAPSYTYREEVRVEVAKKMPWELWQPFQDLEGRSIANRQIIVGDEFVEQGKRRSALDAYLSAGAGVLPANEAEAAVIRVASQHLALDNPKEALSAIGSFFKRRGASETEVSVPFALLLAFAYGRHGDVDQSLAWFSQVSTQGRAGGPAAHIASSASAMLLRTLSDVEFERIGVKWQEDTFVNRSVGRERLRRTSVTYDPDDYRSDKPFWFWLDPSESPKALVSTGVAEVGLLVSLSDRFAALGRDTRQGFELAVEASEQQGEKPRVEVRDVGADSVMAAAAVRELVEGARVSIIAGPLLTEPAVVAAQTAQELGMPLVSFSKSESFQTGNGIFRLGATSSSQMQALVNSTFGHYGISTYAVVYPQTASGIELREAFRKKIASAGLTVDLDLGYVATDDASLIELVQQLESSSADAVLIADNLEVSEKILRQFSPALRKRMRPLGSALWDNAQKIARSQALFERSVFVSPFFTQSMREEVQRFNDSYRAKYGTMPNFLAAQGFDAGTLIMTALQRQKSSGKRLEDVFAHVGPYQGITGIMTVEPSGEIQRSFYVIEVLRDSFQEKSSLTGMIDNQMTGAGSAFSSSGPGVPMLGSAVRVESGY